MVQKGAKGISSVETLTAGLLHGQYFTGHRAVGDGSMLPMHHYPVVP